MFKYEGAKCPVCHSYLMEEDDIVVCPDCGAPHHRDCWNYLQHCGCEELHRAGKSWTPPTPRQSPPTASSSQSPPQQPPQETVVCPACGTKNKKSNLFCDRCGYSFLDKTPPVGPQPGQQPFPPFWGNQPGPIPVAMSPLGGVDPEEDIDGVKAKDLAAVVGQNSMYYIPRFKAMAQNRKTKIPNFAAFFFGAPWMIFRQMILPGIGWLLLTLALEVPNFYIAMQSTTINNTVATSQNISNAVLYLSFACIMISWALKAFLCFFGNRFYMKRCIRLAKSLRETTSTEEEFMAAAKKSGGVKPLYLYILGGLFIVLYFIYFWFLMVV